MGQAIDIRLDDVSNSISMRMNWIKIGLLCMAWAFPLQLFANAMPNSSVKKVPDLRDEKEKVVVKERNFVVVPIPLSNPTLGTGLVLGAAYFYKQSAEQKEVQPASVTAVAGMYTTNESYAYGVGQQNYWDEDKWRFSGFVGHVDLQLDLRRSDPSTGSVDVDWLINGNFLQAKLLRRIAGDWYGGIQTRYFDNTQTFSTSISGEGFATDVNLRTVGAGLNLEFDTRDVPANAYSGQRFELSALFNVEAVGSSDSYQGYDGSFRSYHEVTPKLVLAWEVQACYKSGKVPLWDACKVNLRGFAITEYLSKTSMSGQFEGRWRPFQRFGFVAFAGGGFSDRAYTDIRDDEMIPSYGVGARWMVMKAQRINMRIDYARSDSQDAWYLAVSEAF
jgi:hypothetical protein